MVLPFILNGYSRTMVQTVGKSLYWHVDGVDRKVYKAVYRSHLETQKCKEFGNTKAKIGESLRNFFTRFNATTTLVDSLDPSMVSMTAISGIADGMEFNDSLERDRPMDLKEYYHEVERFL